MPLSPLDRKIALMRAGITMSDIARGLGVTPGHVAQVVNNDRRSGNVESAVADAIGLPVGEVFESVNREAVNAKRP